MFGRSPIRILILAAALLAGLLPLSGGRRVAASVRTDGLERISPVLDAQLHSHLRSGRPARISVIVQVKPDFYRLNELRRGRVQPSRSSLPLVHSYTSRLTASQILLLLDSSVVEYVTRDEPIRSMGRSSPAEDASSDSYLSAIGVDGLHARGYDGRGVGVAVFDSGIGEHDDLPVVRSLADFTVYPPRITRKHRDSDDYGHGTHVAGIIAARRAVPDPTNRQR